MKKEKTKQQTKRSRTFLLDLISRFFTEEGTALPSGHQDTGEGVRFPKLAWKCSLFLESHYHRLGMPMSIKKSEDLRKAGPRGNFPWKPV